MYWWQQVCGCHGDLYEPLAAALTFLLILIVLACLNQNVVILSAWIITKIRLNFLLRFVEESWCMLRLQTLAAFVSFKIYFWIVYFFECHRRVAETLPSLLCSVFHMFWTWTWTDPINTDHVIIWCVAFFILTLGWPSDFGLKSGKHISPRGSLCRHLPFISCRISDIFTSWYVVITQKCYAYIHIKSP